MEQERAKTPVIPCEVQAIRIGDLGIVTNGAEFFCQLGLDIKAASPFARTWVVSLANDWIGYVATPSAYYAGGYEPRTARSAKMAPWAGQSLVEGSLAALKQVQRAGRSEVVIVGLGFTGPLLAAAEGVEWSRRRRIATRSQKPRIHSWAACSALARVGQGIASQVGMSPIGEVISWTHC